MSAAGDVGRIPSTDPIVVGIVPETVAVVVGAAAELALELGVELHAVHVDASRYVVRRDPDGSQVSLPIDPDLDDEPDSGREQWLRAQVQRSLATYDVDWSFRLLAGEPAHELALLASLVHARMIVVGTRKRGVRRRVEEFFTGSVAVHLAHGQPLPVLVVPTDPSSLGGPHPWE